MSSLEIVVSELRAFGNTICNADIALCIDNFGDHILAAVEAERREWQKERLVWKRRVKMAASMAKVKAFNNNNQNKED